MMISLGTRFLRVWLSWIKVSLIAKVKRPVSQSMMIHWINILFLFNIIRLSKQMKKKNPYFHMESLSVGYLVKFFSSSTSARWIPSLVETLVQHNRSSWKSLSNISRWIHKKTIIIKEITMDWLTIYGGLYKLKVGG